MKKLIYLCLMPICMLSASEQKELFFNYGVIESKMDNFDPFARETNTFYEFVSQAYMSNQDELYKIVFLKKHAANMQLMHHSLCDELGQLLKIANILNDRNDENAVVGVLFDFKQSHYSYFKNQDFDAAVKTYFSLKYYWGARTQQFSNADVAHHWRIFNNIYRKMAPCNHETESLLAYIYGYCKHKISQTYKNHSRSKARLSKLDDTLMEELQALQMATNIVPEQQNIEIACSVNNNNNQS